MVSDTHKGIIYKVTSEGSASVYAKGVEDPMGLCWSGGALYTAETGRHRIVKLASGGSGRRDIYIADTANSAVRCLRDGQVKTIAARDASAGENTFFTPTGLLI